MKTIYALSAALLLSFLVPIVWPALLLSVLAALAVFALQGGFTGLSRPRPLSIIKRPFLMHLADLRRYGGMRDPESGAVYDGILQTTEGSAAVNWNGEWVVMTGPHQGTPVLTLPDPMVGILALHEKQLAERQWLTGTTIEMDDARFLVTGQPQRNERGERSARGVLISGLRVRYATASEERGERNTDIVIRYA